MYRPSDSTWGNFSKASNRKVGGNETKGPSGGEALQHKLNAKRGGKKRGESRVERATKQNPITCPRHIYVLSKMRGIYSPLDHEEKRSRGKTRYLPYTRLNTHCKSKSKHNLRWASPAGKEPPAKGYLMCGGGGTKGEKIEWGKDLLFPGVCIVVERELGCVDLPSGKKEKDHQREVGRDSTADVASKGWYAEIP